MTEFTTQCQKSGWMAYHRFCLKPNYVTLREREREKLHSEAAFLDLVDDVPMPLRSSAWAGSCCLLPHEPTAPSLLMGPGSIFDIKRMLVSYEEAKSQ